VTTKKRNNSDAKERRHAVANETPVKAKRPLKGARPTDVRESLLDAAEDVIIEHGVNDLTLETVAARAGVSKGGLLYHFPSKDALIQAMVSRIASLVRECFSIELAAEPSGRGRHARALLRLMMSGKGPLLPRLKQVAAPLLAAMASNPTLLDPMRSFLCGVRQGMMADGMPADTSWLVLAALDGVKFWRIFNVLEPSQADLEQLQGLLGRIIDESSE
jgi:AcrR family transcriptional regulator